KMLSPYLPKDKPLLNYLIENENWCLLDIQELPADKYSLLYIINNANDDNLEIVEYVVRQMRSDPIRWYLKSWIRLNYHPSIILKILSTPNLFVKNQTLNMIVFLASFNSPFVYYRALRGADYVDK